MRNIIKADRSISSSSFAGASTIKIAPLAWAVPTRKFERVPQLALMAIAATKKAADFPKIVMAVLLRRDIIGDWLWAIGGVISVLIGVTQRNFPGAGLLAIICPMEASTPARGALMPGPNDRKYNAVNGRSQMMCLQDRVAKIIGNAENHHCHSPWASRFSLTGITIRWMANWRGVAP